MKIKVLFILISILIIAGAAQAQLPPSYDGFTNPNNLISVKTDPVLSDPKSMISIKTDPVLSDPKGMISVKTDPVLKTLSESIDGFSVNFQPIMDLISSLEKSGAKVSYRVVESKGLVLLEVTVNGKMISPFILNEGVIVYEY